MATPKMSKQELLWRAQSDADTMARYDEIMSDSKRRTAAVKAAKEQADKLNKQAAAMTRVSNKTNPKKK